VCSPLLRPRLMLNRRFLRAEALQEFGDRKGYLLGGLCWTVPGLILDCYKSFLCSTSATKDSRVFDLVLQILRIWRRLDILVSGGSGRWVAMEPRTSPHAMQILGIGGVHLMDHVRINSENMCV
jgi:hypothetical protein